MDIPTLYDWAGGNEKLEQLTALFYSKVQPDEPMPRWGWGVPVGPYHP